MSAGSVFQKVLAVCGAAAVLAGAVAGAYAVFSKYHWFNVGTDLGYTHVEAYEPKVDDVADELEDYKRFGGEALEQISALAQRQQERLDRHNERLEESERTQTELKFVTREQRERNATFEAELREARRSNARALEVLGNRSIEVVLPPTPAPPTSRLQPESATAAEEG